MLKTLENQFMTLNQKAVQVDLKSAITVPFIFEKFEFVDFGEYIGFGGNNTEVFPFEIWKDMIRDIVIDEDSVKFKVVNKINGMSSYIIVLDLEM